MIKLTRFCEPPLQFGASTHIDVRFGIMNYGPLDFDSDDAPRRIRVGVMGSAESLEGLRDWLTKCRDEIPAKQSRQPNLFPRFPGFHADAAFRSELFFDSSLERQLRSSEIDAIVGRPLIEERKVEAVRVFTDYARSLFEKKPPDVLVVALPQPLLDAFEPPAEAAEPDGEPAGGPPPGQNQLDFHDLLKARCMTPSPSNCGKTYHIQCVRFRPARTSANACS